MVLYGDDDGGGDEDDVDSCAAARLEVNRG